MRKTGKDGSFLTKTLGQKVQLVGDDLFVTNTERLAKGIALGCGNSILIKLNQIGSVSETLEAIKMAHKAGVYGDCFPSFRRDGRYDYRGFLRWRSIRVRSRQARRAEVRRVAKYNQLLRIEEELGAGRMLSGALMGFNIKK